MVRDSSASQDRWRQVEDLFHRLVLAPPAQRERVLAEETTDDVTRAEARSLLGAHEAAGATLDAPAFEPEGDAEASGAGLLLFEHRIGPYRLVRLLGRGGMGAVFEAEQDPPRRRVALKVLHGGALIDERQALFFQREVAALARLAHPGIARLYDAGRSARGEPYFTMELVEGERLDRHVVSCAPSLTERIVLFGRICAAVAFAHQRGVIHCDLKPSNILVTADGAEPAIKILDFGLARLTDGDGTETVPAQMQGSLAFMSPEQTRLCNVHIDVRADVYALGVILYGLLADGPPYVVDGLAPWAAARAICETPPRPLPSHAPGELVTIVQKAIAKDPGDRYQGVAELAEDVRRFQADEPLLARPRSAAYQVRKFVRRHRLGVAAAAAILVLTVAIAVVAAVQAARASRQRDEAARLQALSERVVEWWGQTVLGAVQPRTVSDPAQGLRDVLELRAAAIDPDFAGEPRVQAMVHHMFGSSWRALGDFGKAAHHLERAVALRETALGRHHPQTLSALNDLAVVSTELGHPGPAEQIYREVLEVRCATLSPEEPLLLTSLGNLGWFFVECGLLDQAEPLLRRTLEARRRVLAPDDPDLLRSMNNLAVLFTQQGLYEDAEPLMRETLAARRRIFPEHHPQVLACTANLAKTLLQRGAWEECGSLLEPAATLARRALGERHGVTCEILDALSSLRLRQGRHDEARELCEQALGARRQLLGEDHPQTLVSLRHLGMIARACGNVVEAERTFRKLLDIQRGRLPPGSPSVLSVVNLLYVLYSDLGRHDRAEALIEETWAELEEALGPDHPSVLALRSDLGRVALFLGDFERSERVLTDVLERQTRSSGPRHERTLRTTTHLGTLFRETGRHQQALPLFEQSFEALRERLGFRHSETLAALAGLATLHADLKSWERAAELYGDLARGLTEGCPAEPGFAAEALRNQGRCLREQGRYADAEPVLLEAWRRLEGIGGQDDRRRAVARTLARLYAAWGRADEAERWRSRSPGQDVDAGAPSER